MAYKGDLSLFELAAERKKSRLMPYPHGEGPQAFTCDECPGARQRCPSRFDWYCTDGDCLEDK